MMQNIKAMDEIWKSSTAVFANQKTELNYKKFDELLGSIFCSGPFYYFVIDWTGTPEPTLSYVDQTAADFFNIPKDELSLGDVINNIHPDDMEYVLACERQVLKFIQNVVDPADLPYYKFTNMVRMKNKLGKYVLIQHQAVVLSFTPEGAMNHAITVHTDISHITTVSNRTLSIIGMAGRPSYMNIDPLNPNFSSEILEYSFSFRELEVIRLSASGYSSKQIGEKLNISILTVATHRKNLMQKSSCSNMTEVVSKCIRSGLI